MAERGPIPLTPLAVKTSEAGYTTLLGWVYPPESSYVSRILRDIIPLREKNGHCRVWVYADPTGQIVGFGTLDLADDWRAFSSGLLHPYIPLLSANPGIKSMGYGGTIVDHLTAEAATLVRSSTNCSNLLFLDVYSTNDNAIALYERNGFARVAVDHDPDEDGSEYLIMSRNVAFA